MEAATRYPKYLNLASAMEYMGVKSYTTMQKLIANGLPVVIVGGLKRIDRDDLDKFMNSKKI